MGRTWDDGADDIDHDGLTNAEEGNYAPRASSPRRADWCTVYVSTGPGQPHTGTGDPAKQPDPYARVDPFNPCKPVYSQACHQFVPQNYYVNTDTYVEDWAGAEPDPNR